MATSNPINTVRKQRDLRPRKEPYWHPIRRGAYVGLYVGTTQREWKARALDLSGAYKFATLGHLEDLDYAAAEAKAREFADLATRTERPNYTVGAAIEDYLKDVRTRSGAGNALAAEQRLGKHVGAELRAVRLVDLRSVDLTRWRDALVRESDDPDDIRRSKDGANRLLSILKAALNLAFRQNFTPSDAEWRRVQAFAKVDNPRLLFLSPEQVQDLLSAVASDFGDLLQAAVFTGARFGELAAARTTDFDAKHGTLHLDGKTGPRTCYLSGEAVSFFRGLTKGKLPNAPLLMKACGTSWGKSHQRRPMAAAVAASELPPETVFYSLRHYHISRALLAGIPAQVIAENCGTSVRMIEKHYGHFARADRRAMLDKVSL